MNFQIPKISNYNSIASVVLFQCTYTESVTLLEELMEQEKHQAALDSQFKSTIAELKEKNSNLEARLSDLESTNTELTSTNKLLEKELADSEEKEKITSHRLSQDLTKERQYGHTMSMRVDMLSNENRELTERLTKVLLIYRVIHVIMMCVPLDLVAN